MEACSLTVSHPSFLGPSVKCDFWICCSSIMPVSNVTLLCHFRIELRKNQAREGNSYPSIYLRGGERNNGNNKVASQRFLSFSLSALIQNIIPYYCGRSRWRILRFGDSLHFPYNSQRTEDPRVKWLICLRTQSKLNCSLRILFSQKHSRSSQ